VNSEDGNFEEPIVRLRRRIEELSALPDDAAHRREIEKLREKLDRVSREIYANLTPWQKTLVARHPGRPYPLDYIEALTTEFVELHGDRKFSDDAAVVAGLARFRGRPVAVVGHQKGRDTKEKIRRNFGMPRPEGFRKALRVMELAEKFGRPILSFVDTAGAYPGIDAEERGQAEAIAVNLREMARFHVPIIVTVTGEGGSGGALALGIGDRVLMLEHSTYSVISPEGCASILWKDAGRKKDAAEAMRLTAADLRELDVIDEIVPEPPGGAHADPAGSAAAVGEAIDRNLAEVADLTAEERRERRYRRFRSLGRFETAGPS
jgi:acetyl-CoA carboxylase carboxyl transferase subunit alpha